MENLITENIEVGAPANPVIVQNVASLPGGVEVHVNLVNADYPGGVTEYHGQYYPKVLKAGHPVYQTHEGRWKTYYIDDDGEFMNSITEDDAIAHAVGVITEDAHVYTNADDEPCAICSIMLIGIVDASQMPAKLSKDSIINLGTYEYSGIAYMDGALDVCQIAFINRPPMHIA